MFAVVEENADAITPKADASRLLRRIPHGSPGIAPFEHLHAGRNLVGGGFCLCEPLFERCERLGPERRSARDEEKQEERKTFHS